MSWLSDLFGGNTQAGSSSTSGPPAWLQNDLAGFNAAGRQAASMAPYGGQQVANLSGLQTGAMQNMAALMGGTPGLSAANNYGMEMVADGGYNPFTEQVAGNTMRDLERSYAEALGRSRASHAMSGVFGSTGQDTGEQDLAEGFSRGATSALGNIYNQGFENAQGRRASGAGLLSSLYGQQIGAQGAAANMGQMGRSYEQQLLDAQRDNYYQPRQDLQWYGQNILQPTAGSAGQTRTSTETQGNNALTTGLGVAGSLWSMFGGGKRGNVQ